MSWFTLAFTKILPFVADVFETRDIRQSGDKLFGGLASQLKEVAGEPDKVREIAAMLEEKKGELTGAIVARTPAAGLVDPEFMPPGSVDLTQEAVVIPTGPTGATGMTGTTGTSGPTGTAGEDEYEYDDSDDDEPEDEQDAPKPKTAAKKKKK